MCSSDYLKYCKYQRCAMPELKRILYVEDAPDIQAIAKVALEAIGGFDVKICNSGDEALVSAVEFAPDLLLLDVMMPGMDGPATLAALREIPALNSTPAIFMTGKVKPDEVHALRQHGAIDVIAKPFDPMTLADTIRESWSKIS